jgi:homogentisate 1,2-dioxygenase
MPVYQKQGKIPHKRHVVFRSDEGQLYHEVLFGTEGFSSTSSLLYHLYPPTMVKEIGKAQWARPEVGLDENLKALSFMGFEVEAEDDYLQSRKVFFFNDDMQIGMAAPSKSMKDYFFKNADSDEMLFIHKGSGRCLTAYGTVDFVYGDYVIIPRGTVYKLEFDSSENKILFV